MVLLLALVGAAFGCDVAKLTAARDAAAAAPNADLARRKVLGALATSCTFPAKIAETMRSMQSASTIDSYKLEVAGIRQTPQEWITACPAGNRALEQAANVRGPQRRDALYAPCGLERYKFSTSEELATADGYVLLATLVARHFEDVSVEDRVAIPVLRALAGIGTKPATTPAPAGADVWASARQETAGVAILAWDARDEAGWTEIATAMLGWCDALVARPIAERRTNKQVEFDTCVQAGRAASNASLSGPPHVKEINGTPIVVGYWAAVLLANGSDDLIRNMRDAEVRNTLTWYLQQLRKGQIPATR
jgi:hypothetical protein